MNKPATVPIAAPGAFIVDNSGQVKIDFIADSGGAQGELAIFSLQGMENLTYGSTDFIRESARRALTNSALGYVAISDPNEGAHFSGDLGEGNLNSGTYLGEKTFTLKSGTKFALLFVPRGTVQNLFNSPSIDDNNRPFFSIAAANPQQGNYIAQLITETVVDGGVFGFEDVRIDRNSDRDYNDFFFQVKGAIGQALSLDQLINPQRDWRKMDFGKQLVNYALSTGTFDREAPRITAALVNDTGLSGSDRITASPDIFGFLSDRSAIVSFKAGLNGTQPLIDVLPDLQPDGSFLFTQKRLEEIKEGKLSDGTYTLLLQATDKVGQISEVFKLDFTLSSAPS
ncbi:MAG: DUF4114 domain-containing protein [Brasilonema sp.]